VEPKEPLPVRKPRSLLKSRRALPFLHGVAAAILIGFLGSAVVTYIQPREYLGRVTFEVSQEAVDHFTKVWNESTGQSLSPPEAQADIIRSDRVLGLAVDKCRLLDDHYLVELASATSREEAISFLRDSTELEIDPKKPASLSLEVYYFDPHSAVNLANGIVEAYQAYLDKPALHGDKSVLEAFLATEAQQEMAVEEKKNAMLAVMKEHEVVDPSSFLFPFYSVTDDVNEYISEMQTKLDSVRDLHGEQLEARIVSIFPGRSLGAEYEAFRNSRATGGDLDSRDRPWSQLVKGAAETQSVYQTRMEITKASLLNAHKAPPSVTGFGSELESYVDAKRRYMEADLELTRLQKTRLAEIDRKVPDFEPIAIQQSTLPSEIPARPLVRLQLMAGLVIGVIASPFSGLAFAFWAGIHENWRRAHPRKPRKPKPPNPRRPEAEW
jgi:hypothetical protein